MTQVPKGVSQVLAEEVGIENAFLNSGVSSLLVK